MGRRRRRWWARPSDEHFGPGGLSDGPVDLSKLPTDPAQLAAMISSRKIEGGPPGPAEDFVQVGDLLRESDASPALRAALFKVAAGIPGVKLLGTVTDSDGRSGIAIAFPHSARDGEAQRDAQRVPASRLRGQRRAVPRADVQRLWRLAVGQPQRPAAQPQPERQPGPGGRLAGDRAQRADLRPGHQRAARRADRARSARTARTKLLRWSDYLLSGVVDSVSDVPPPSSVP